MTPSLTNFAYCADILCQERGEAVLNVLDAAFPPGFWLYWSSEVVRQLDDGSKRRVQLRNPRGLERTEYLQTFWNREALPGDSAPSDLIYSRDRAASVRFTFGPQGGTRPCGDNPGRVRLWPNETSLSIREEGIANGYAERMKAVFPVLSQLTEASYGYSCSLDDVSPWTLYTHLLGVRWLTQFGPDLVDLIGRTRFNGLPVHSVQHLADGGIVVVLCETFDEYCRSDHREHEHEVEKRLGVEWFRPGSPLETEWVKLRNLNLSTEPIVVTPTPSCVEVEVEAPGGADENPLEILSLLLEQVPDAQQYCYAQSSGFWDEQADDEQLEDLYAEYEGRYRSLVDDVTRAWGAPEVLAPESESELTSWTGASDISLWKRDLGFAVVWWEHQDREMPVRLMLSAMSLDEVKSIMPSQPID